jgi:AcrR family transcriptional regulator
MFTKSRLSLMTLGSLLATTFSSTAANSSRLSLGVRSGTRRLRRDDGFDEQLGQAPSGKPTIYARFPNKEALFTAVVMQNVAANIARFEDHTPTGATIEGRLESVAITILQWVLVSDAVSLMRVAIAEARRFPDLASSVHRMARERGAEAVARLLAEAAKSDELGTLPAFAPERLTTTTRFFQDLVYMPLLIRALFGEKLKPLRAEIGPHVTRSVAFFLAACRHGGVIESVPQFS